MSESEPYEAEGRRQHEIRIDIQAGLFWIKCPNSDGARIPLAKEPKYCPMCGQRLDVWVGDQQC
jgi:hypothetical protein